MARPRRSTSAAPAGDDAKPTSGANGSSRSKRPRVSDVDENGASTSKPAAAVAAGAADDKAPANTTKEAASPAAKKAEVKRRRISVVPKLPKNIVNPLPEPFGVLESAVTKANGTKEWQLATQVDPRKTGKPLSVFAVGNGDMGQLGMGTDTTDELRRPRLHFWFDHHSQYLPKKLEIQGARPPPPEDPNAAAASKPVDEEEKEAQSEPTLGKLGVEDVACGGMHSLIVDSNGKIWTWGINDNGALGRITQNTGVDSDELEYTPMQITKLEDSFRAVRVAASDSASLALSDKGEVRVWGSFRAADGLLGFDNNTKIQTLPVSLPGMARLPVAEIACGENHVLLLTSGGQVYSFGNGETGQLGRHSSARRRLNGLIPERIGNLTDIVHVAAGDNHSFAVKKDGTVYGWGLNLHKQLGIVDSTSEEQGHLSTPVEIESLSPSEHDGHKIVQIGGGTFHSVFLFDNGQVYVCGGNDEHELGLSKDNIAITQQDKEKNYISPPVKLDFPQTETTSATINDGQETTKTTATTKIVKLAIGTRHSFALGENGDLYGWGLAGAEQLGCNAAGEETVPTPKRVAGKTINEYRVLGMATGGQHSIMIAAKAPGSEEASSAPATNGTS